MIEQSNKQRLWFNPANFKWYYTQEEPTYILYTREDKNTLLKTKTEHDDVNTFTTYGLDSDNKLKINYVEKPLEEKQNYIRAHRKECFGIVNRGNTWHNTLTETQKQELQTWYQAWLDAPDTLVIPERPAWLK